MEPVIPPPPHAVVHGKDNTKWHDHVAEYIKEKGTVYAFHKNTAMGLGPWLRLRFHGLRDVLALH